VYLSSLAREIVGGLQGASDALLNGGVATVVGRQNGVLGDGDTGADGCNICVEDKGNNGAVVGDLGAHGSLRASGTTITDASDLDL
jgi:hypothetical protein